MMLRRSLVLRLFLGELADVDQPLRQRLIAVSWRASPAAHQVAARVADLRQVEPVAPDARDGGRGPHAAHLGVFAGIVVDLEVGQLDRLAQPVGEPVARRRRGRCRQVSIR